MAFFPFLRGHRRHQKKVRGLMWFLVRRLMILDVGESLLSEGGREGGGKNAGGFVGQPK